MPSVKPEDWGALRAEAKVLHERLMLGPSGNAAEDAALLDRAVELQSLGFAMSALLAMTAGTRRH
jgi:hypothetical protein